MFSVKRPSVSDNVVDKHVNACHFQAGGMFHFVLYAVGNALGDGGNVQTIPHFDMQCDDQTGKTISNKLQLTPLKDEDPGTEDPEPKPEQIDITFSTGELLYLPNGMLLINLFETDNTSVYQTQIKLEGIENNGA